MTGDGAGCGTPGTVYGDACRSDGNGSCRSILLAGDARALEGLDCCPLRAASVGDVWISIAFY